MEQELIELPQTLFQIEDGADTPLPSIPAKRRRKEIANKAKKIEAVLSWLENGYTIDDIKSEMVTWIDDEKLVNRIIDEALEEFNKPKPLEDRVLVMENKIRELESVINDLSEIKPMVNEMYSKLISGG